MHDTNIDYLMNTVAAAPERNSSAKSREHSVSAGFSDELLRLADGKSSRRDAGGPARPSSAAPATPRDSSSAPAVSPESNASHEQRREERPEESTDNGHQPAVPVAHLDHSPPSSSEDGPSGANHEACDSPLPVPVDAVGASAAANGGGMKAVAEAAATASHANANAADPAVEESADDSNGVNALEVRTPSENPGDAPSLSPKLTTGALNEAGKVENAAPDHAKVPAADKQLTTADTTRAERHSHPSIQSDLAAPPISVAEVTAASDGSDNHPQEHSDTIVSTAGGQNVAPAGGLAESATGYDGEVSELIERNRPASRGKSDELGSDLAASKEDSQLKTTSAGELPWTPAEPTDPTSPADSAARAPASQTERASDSLSRPRGAADGAREAAPKGDLNRIDADRFVGRVAKAFQAAQERGGVLRLRLSPPELGSLQLELTVKEGALTASLETETPAARRLLLDHLPALRDRLAEQNVRVEKFDVDVRRDGQDSRHPERNQPDGAPDRDNDRRQNPRSSPSTRSTKPIERDVVAASMVTAGNFGGNASINLVI